MCGIAGAVFRDGKLPSGFSGLATKVLHSLGHRGPDMSGQYHDGGIWLGHVRLSILDLSEAARQPMSTPEGGCVLCYNGEVYNFRELAMGLGLSNLNTHSDTEVILHAFAGWGEEILSRLNGMFAFAFYDRLRKRLWLVRDRLGIKPLFYSFNHHGLFFASEIKALLAMEAVKAECDTSTLHEWLYFGTSLGERSLYRGVQKLLPGHCLEIDLGDFELNVREYWGPRHAVSNLSGNPKDAIGTTRTLLEQAVQRQLVSDVPVGVFLSGGIDSSAITAFASRHYSGRLRTYSVGFDFDRGVNELPKAAKVARLFGTEHHEMHVSGVTISDVVRRMVRHHDQPFSDAANIPLFLLAENVQGETKVVLQGDGGDELFGGYQRYSTLKYFRLARCLAAVGKLANCLMPRNRGYFSRRRYFNALTAPDIASVMALLLTVEDRLNHPGDVFAPDVRSCLELQDPFSRYRQCAALFPNEDVVNTMLLVDTMIVLPDVFLEKVDRATMAASLEVRVPFLDNDLVELCLGLSSDSKLRWGRKKWLLKKALEGTVPNDILYGRKTGFGVPYGYWLRTALKQMFFDYLENFRRSRPCILNVDRIRSMFDEDAAGRQDHSFMLWKLLNFMVWTIDCQVSIR